MFIIGNNETNQIYNQVSVAYTDIKTPQQVLDFKNRIIAKYAAKLSIDPSYLDFFWIDEIETEGSDFKRIMNGDEFVVVWANDKITGVDFSTEDAKGYLKFETNKTEIRGDGVDTATITLTVYQPDKVTVKNITAARLIPIKTPSGIISARMAITNGIGTLQFKKINDLPLGKYSIPVHDKYVFGHRIWEFVQVDVYLQM